ncbi:MAG: hypothetical protein HY690_01415 [Chloroflexi bacterium]|nr:hypothetical protein [Chloroflexota bacterium]
MVVEGRIQPSTSNLQPIVVARGRVPRNPAGAGARAGDRGGSLRSYPRWEPALQLREYLAVAHKRWWVVLLVVVSAAAASFIFARLQTPLYRSSVRLEVSGDLDYGNTLAIEKRLQQFAQRVRTTAIARQVDRNLRADLGEEALLDKVKVAAVPENLQIQIEVDDVDPERAQRIAQEFARVYQEQHTASEQGKVQEKQVLIAPLDQPTEPRLSWPQTRVLVLAAGLLGLVLGLVLVFGLEYLDDTLKTPEDVERYLGLTTLGAVPLDRRIERPHPKPVRAGALVAR